MNKAVFLDRDGVINPLVYNLMTGAYESPHMPEDFSLYPYVERALRRLKNAGFLNIVVSNQPSFAKGKPSLENIQKIEKILSDFSKEHGELIDAAYYCYHHPNGIVPAYTGNCSCRKPGTLFLQQAAKQFSLNASKCWLIGDRDSDVLCGSNFGCRTIKIDHLHAEKSRENVKADYHAANLEEAVNQIIKGD